MLPLTMSTPAALNLLICGVKSSVPPWKRPLSMNL